MKNDIKRVSKITLTCVLSQKNVLFLTDCIASRHFYTNFSSVKLEVGEEGVGYDQSSTVSH